MIKYAVIGTGWITQSFVDGANLHGLKFCGVYSRRPETGLEFAQRNGCSRVYTDLDELAESDADAVYIASPNFLHYAHSKRMLEGGKHVICEKPITVTPEELSELQTIAREKRLVYMEAIMHMHNPVRELVSEAIGEIGVISGAHFDFSQLSSKYPALKRGELPNIFNPEMATGCLMDLGIYCVYPAIDWFGVPKSINASAHFIPTGADGAGDAFFDYDDMYVSMTWSKLGQSRLGSQIYGDRGTIVIESISKLTFIRIVFNDGSERVIWEDTDKAVLMGNEAKRLCDFISDPDCEEYARCSEKALLVSKAMKEIRDKAGIEFGGKYVL